MTDQDEGGWPANSALIKSITPEWIAANPENAVVAARLAGELVQRLRTALGQMAYTLAMDRDQAEALAERVRALGLEATPVSTYLSLAGMCGMCDTTLGGLRLITHHLEAIEQQNAAMFQAMMGLNPSDTEGTAKA